MTKAPLGGEETGNNPTDRGKIGTKRSMLTDGQGVPLGMAVSGASVHDKRLVKQTIQSIPVTRPKVTRKRPQNLCQDKGYDYPDVRQLVSDVGYTAHIPVRGVPPAKRKNFPVIALDAGSPSERTHGSIGFDG